VPEQLHQSTPIESNDAQRDLVFVLPHLGPGGAQRVASLLLNYWQEHGVSPAVLTLYRNPDAYRLHPRILREDFAPNDGPRDDKLLARLYFHLEAHLSEEYSSAANRVLRDLTKLLLDGLRSVRAVRASVLNRLSPNRGESYAERRVAWLRSRLQALSPKVVVSFVGSTNIQTLIAARELSVKVVISERNDPALQLLDPPWENMRPLVYPEADIVTANSAGALITMQSYVPAEKLRQVANPLEIRACPQSEARRQQRLIVVARLVQQKAVDVLIHAFARLATLAPDWELDIVGDGPQRPQLQHQAANLGVVERIHFHGHVSDPFPLLCRAGIFVLPSRFEGMPNSMLEAMACGLAVIVSNASPGPLELIRHEQTGLVFPVDDVDALAAAAHKLIVDDTLRIRLGRAALDVAADMAVPVVVAKWESLMREVGLDLQRSEAD